MSGCENRNLSVNNGKDRVRSQSCDYKYSKKAFLDTNFGLCFLGFYLTKMLHFWNLSLG